MTISVTCDMFSGRPNPTWELSPNEIKKLNTLASKKRSIYVGASPSTFFRLGYRGLIISSTDQTATPELTRVFDGVLHAGNVSTPLTIDEHSEIEIFLLETSGVHLSPYRKKYILDEIKKNWHAGAGGVNSSLSRGDPLDPPPYQPELWNQPGIQGSNNCYNYGCNKRTDTFAQPGRGSNNPYHAPADCVGVGAAAISDGLTRWNSSTTVHGHLMALAVEDIGHEEQPDYHWYRKDNDKFWSHKPGPSPAIDYDDKGKQISDPQRCDRGIYKNFCGYFVCVPNSIHIR